MTKYRTKESENENETRTNNFDNTDGYVCVCVLLYTGDEKMMIGLKAKKKLP